MISSALRSFGLVLSGRTELALSEGRGPQAFVEVDCFEMGIDRAMARADRRQKPKNHLQLWSSDDMVQIGQRTARPLHD